MTDRIAAQLRELAARMEAWLLHSAFPLWWDKGADRAHGGFHELLDLDARPVENAPRRMRVQARQCYAYATAGTLGWTGPWQHAVRHGLDHLASRYGRDDGQFRTLVAADGTILDDTAMLYDQAFALLAMASADDARCTPKARRLSERIAQIRRHPGGGYVESAPCRFQSNPHMHLLEAALAWAQIDSDGPWDALADEIVVLCRSRFIDPQRAFLREFFDEAWQPASGPPGCIIEPGHQFEWAWLLERWGRLRGDAGARDAARALYDAGARGIDPGRGVAIDEMSDDYAVTRATARLWPQTERLKAALILAQGNESTRYRNDAVGAAAALWRYFETPTSGLWRDKMLADGRFVEEPAPASSFYHIVCALAALKGAARPE